MLLIGSHVSFKKDTQLLGSVKEALSYGSNCFMFYTGAPQNTSRCNIDDSLTKEAVKLMEENNIDINNSKIIYNLRTFFIYLFNSSLESFFDDIRNT